MGVINTYDNQNNVVTIPTTPTTSQGVPIQQQPTTPPQQEGVQGSQPVGGATTPPQPNNIWAQRQAQREAQQKQAVDNAMLQQGVAAGNDRRAMEQYGEQYAQYKNGELPNAPEIPQPTASTPSTQSVQGAKPVDGTSPSSTPQTFDAFRRSLYDEDKIRRQSDTRAKVMALGDAIRHIGNLGYTMAGATPQQFKDAPATQERLDYEQGKQLRDQYAYQRWSDKQKRDIAAAEQARKDLELKWNIAGKQADIEFKNTQTGKLLQEIGYNEKNYPVQLQKAVAEYNNLVAQGKVREAEAKLKQVQAEWLPKEKQSVIDKNKASATASYAAANASNQHAALYKKQVANYESDHSFEIPDPDDATKSYVIPKGNKDAFNAAMRGIAKQKGWKTEDLDPNTGLLDLAFAHINDPNNNREIVRLLGQLSHDKKVSNTGDSYSIDSRSQKK